MSSETPTLTLTRALLDTTVQLDRVKTAARKQHLDKLLTQYQLKFIASMSIVEFKATIIQECITIHNQLRRSGARFTRVRDALVEKKGQQISLRMHIFNNIINVLPGTSSFDIDEKEDLRLAEKARLQLETIIPYLYKWCSSPPRNVDAVLKDRLCCNRAIEEPIKKRAAFETNLPKCKRGVNKTCKVEQLIRENAPTLLKSITPALADSKQLTKSHDIFRRVLQDPACELSVGDCRNAGDCLIALEANGDPTHILSTNAGEWKPLSNAVDAEFVHITYPDEKTV